MALGYPTEAASRPKAAPGEARLAHDESVFRDRWPGYRQAVVSPA